MPPSSKCVLEGPILEVTEGLLNQVIALKNAGVTGQTVLRMFLLRRILLLKARPALMCEYIGLGDPSMVAEGHLLEESMTRVAWMVLGSASGEPLVDEGQAPLLGV